MIITQLHHANGEGLWSLVLPQVRGGLRMGSPPPTDVWGHQESEDLGSLGVFVPSSKVDVFGDTPGWL